MAKVSRTRRSQARKSMRVVGYGKRATRREMRKARKAGGFRAYRKHK